MLRKKKKVVGTCDCKEELKKFVTLNAHSVFEKEPAPAFVGVNLDKFVDGIIKITC